MIIGRSIPVRFIVHFVVLPETANGQLYFLLLWVCSVNGPFNSAHDPIYGYDKMANPILRVENLSAFIPFNSGPKRCFGDISLEVQMGEFFGLLGERDSGKSCLILAMLGIFEKAMLFRLASMQKAQTMSCRIPPTTQFPPIEKWEGTVSGESHYNGHGQRVDLTKEPYPRDIAYIPEANSRKNIAWFFIKEEDVGSSLRMGGDGPSFHSKLIDVLGLEYLAEQAKAGKPILPRLLKPSELRKIQVLDALLSKPRLLVFDEPVDVFELTERRQVINALLIAREELGMSAVIATQDAGILTELADRIAVLYTGRAVETGDAERMFFDASHPYTKGLMSSTPTIAMERMRRGRKRMLRGIPGAHPDQRKLPTGCTFHRSFFLGQTWTPECCPPKSGTGNDSVRS